MPKYRNTHADIRRSFAVEKDNVPPPDTDAWRERERERLAAIGKEHLLSDTHATGSERERERLKQERELLNQERDQHRRAQEAKVHAAMDEMYPARKRRK